MTPDLGPRLTHQGLQVLKLFLNDPSRVLCGAEIIKTTGIPSGTIYPILLRFERHGLLGSYWENQKPQDIGRPRKRLYRITADGVKVAREALLILVIPIRKLVPVRT